MTLEILTPSYMKDFHRFRLLHRSVLECTDPSVVHSVVVPERDRELFSSISSDRLRIIGYRELLPRFLVRTDWLAGAVARIPGVPRGARFIAVNLRHPLPPLRGWLLQQILKLSAASRSDADTLLILDSDTQLISDVGSGELAIDGRVRYYRAPAAIHAGMERHVAWHRAARDLLGLEDDGPPPYDDPIAGMIAWDPVVVRAMLAHLTELHGRPWEDTLARRWELSEYVLYGEYITALGRDRLGAATDRSGCITWWGPEALTDEAAERLLDDAHPGDLALVVQSTSASDLDTSARVGDWMRSRLR